jgi:type II secretory pathway pseudopilin PulG
MRAGISYYSKQKGLSLIESIISSALILFILSASFLVINSTITTSFISEKKVLLAEQLDKKINQYVLTGRFNATTIANNTFSEVKSSNSKLAKFIGKNKDFGIIVSKEVIKYDKFG